MNAGALLPFTFLWAVLIFLGVLLLNWQSRLRKRGIDDVAPIWNSIGNGRRPWGMAALAHGKDISIPTAANQEDHGGRGENKAAFRG